MPPKLEGTTAQELEYAHKIVELNSISKAYKVVYGKPDQPLSKVTRRAYKIANKPAVLEKIKEIRETLERKELWTKQQSIEILAGVAYGEDPFGDPLKGVRVADRVSAVKELNAMHGWRITDLRSGDGSMTPRSIVTTDPVEAAREYQEIMGNGNSD